MAGARPFSFSFSSAVAAAMRVRVRMRVRGKARVAEGSSVSAASHKLRTAHAAAASASASASSSSSSSSASSSSSSASSSSASSSSSSSLASTSAHSAAMAAAAARMEIERENERRLSYFPLAATFSEAVASALAQALRKGPVYQEALQVRDQPNHASMRMRMCIAYASMHPCMQMRREEVVSAFVKPTCRAAYRPHFNPCFCAQRSFLRGLAIWTFARVHTCACACRRAR